MAPRRPKRLAPIALSWGPAVWSLLCLSLLLASPRFSRSCFSSARGADKVLLQRTQVARISTSVAPTLGRALRTSHMPRHSGGEGKERLQFQDSRRGALCLTLGLLLPCLGGGGPAKAIEKVKVYFGQGCFWHVQHELTMRSLKINKEAKGVYPEGSFSPALTGYAGGRLKNDDGTVCYNSYTGKAYDDLGHAEVVGLELPMDAVEQLAKLYFDEANDGPGRHDPQDTGSAYRSVIGLPGGVKSPAFAAVERANAGRLKLLPGKGGDPDTLGAGTVYIYDTSEFPFYPAELYHQYHDDMTEVYSRGYHGLKGTLQKAGVISKKVGCEV